MPPASPACWRGETNVHDLKLDSIVATTDEQSMMGGKPNATADARGPARRQGKRTATTSATHGVWSDHELG